MSDGTLFKPDKDFTREVDKAIADVQGVSEVSLIVLMMVHVAK
jgi:hypothetical protein